MGSSERQKEEGKCGRQISKSRQAGASMLGNGGVYTMVNRGAGRGALESSGDFRLRRLWRPQLPKQEMKGSALDVVGSEELLSAAIGGK